MPDARTQLVDDGFVVVPGLIARREVDALLGQYRDIVASQIRRLEIAAAPHDAPNALYRDLLSLLRRDQKTYLGVLKLFHHLPALHQLAVGDSVLSLLKRIGMEHPSIAVRPVVHVMAEALKIPGGYHKTPPHQDWSFVQGSLDSAVIWIALTDVDAAHHPLEVWPGSHRFGLMPSRPFECGRRVREDLVREDEFVALPVARGDAVCFSSLTVHRTGRNGRDDARISISFRYNNIHEPGFIERNFHDAFEYTLKENDVPNNAPSAEDMERLLQRRRHSQLLVSN